MQSKDLPYAVAYAPTMTLREMMETYGSDVWHYAFFLTRSREVLLVNYTEDGKGGYTKHSKLLDIATGKSQVLTGTITTEKKKRPAKSHYGAITTDTKEDYFVAHYEVKGERRSVEINMPTGKQWYYDWWNQEYGEKINPSATP
ncbi:hypothetical protein [Paenibacillus graminis]|uniref:Uncharacterized protein n=1 Tax=Paenibacillus graminis TaxID=189425 RepID=A0A089MGC8_9BACL|nr:hypothetical protein [Paenibacillus graminis]AIQ70563.1 hypothetical protein PGRAT_25200 [Paenibacillus graminis]